MLRRTVLVLLAPLLLGAGQPARAALQAGPPEVTAAQDVYVRAPAGSFPPFVSVQVSFERCTGAVVRRLGTASSRGDGDVLYHLVVPRGTEPGCYRVRFTRGTDTATAGVLVRAPQSVRPGGRITVSVPGDGRFDGRPLLTVVLETCAEVRVAELGRVTAEEDTSASLRITVPRSTAPGCHLVRFISGDTAAFTRITVLRAAAAAEPELPGTGAGAGWLAAAAGLLLAAGLVLVLLGRRTTP